MCCSFWQCKPWPVDHSLLYQSLINLCLAQPFKIVLCTDDERKCWNRTVWSHLFLMLVCSLVVIRVFLFHCLVLLKSTDCDWKLFPFAHVLPQRLQSFSLNLFALPLGDQFFLFLFLVFLHLYCVYGYIYGYICNYVLHVKISVYLLLILSWNFDLLNLWHINE